ncbi:unnamed protein product [Didymodactylos carnosus]|uniref:Uncharacterized protein n=1 Tax=Didymodactylos carnosus TaxID=1234261 RepID=A0A813P1N1_9BILA|nr:unnamed protein product [Didymodactylos carnosus]CAF0779393.1 unnamed protein product [Didymodactylos carnosus]CAF3526724.1 unnamed protein product [Didymodactylos carnosus]CAF3560801.1 unnamed protein product [Didymodactylos carnosus]
MSSPSNIIISNNDFSIKLEKGALFQMRNGNRKVWDGRHWRILCEIEGCMSQRQGSLRYRKGLCKKHFNELFSKTVSLSSQQKETKKKSLDSIVDHLLLQQIVKKRMQEKQQDGNSENSLHFSQIKQEDTDRDGIIFLCAITK